MSKPDELNRKIIAQNKKARFDFFIEEEFEAGIVLVGSEVKSVRAGKVSLNDSYAGDIDGEMFAFNLYIQEYNEANQFNHQSRRPRKLLFHKKQIGKLIGKVRTKGYTLVLLSIYFNKANRVKVQVGLAKGKKLHDKRAALKEKEWEREKKEVF
jgi:SsrA-binding protein